MNNHVETPHELLSKYNMKPSHQRIRILEYLASHRNHPSADRIYNDLHQLLPTMSKSTVYSTLKAFAEAGLVRELKIDNETRFEYEAAPHGHFKCETCGTIYDFTIDVNHVPTDGLDGFRINHKSVYFTGVCNSCMQLLMLER